MAKFLCQELIQELMPVLRENRVAGCYLVSGERGTGKLATVRFIAQALLCDEKSPDGLPCGHCPTCKQIEDGSHIDVPELWPEEEGKRISVERVREILKENHNAPSTGDRRVFIFPHTELLRSDSQNALLKSIEEPSDGTVYFLLTEDTSKILPTVQSRAVSLKTKGLTREKMRAYLKEIGCPSERLEEVLVMSGSSPGKALEYLNDTEKAEMRGTLMSYFTAIFEGASFTKLTRILPPAQTNRTELRLFFSMVRAGLHDLITAKHGVLERTSFFTDLPFLKDMASVLSLKRAVALFDRALELESALDTNVNLYSAVSDFHLSATGLLRDE